MRFKLQESLALRDFGTDGYIWFFISRVGAPWLKSSQEVGYLQIQSLCATLCERTAALLPFSLSRVGEA